MSVALEAVSGPLPETVSVGTARSGDLRPEVSLCPVHTMDSGCLSKTQHLVLSWAPSQGSDKGGVGKQSQEIWDQIELHFSFSTWTSVVTPTEGKMTDATALNFEIKWREDGLSEHEVFINTRLCGFMTCS